MEKIKIRISLMLSFLIELRKDLERLKKNLNGNNIEHLRMARRLIVTSLTYYQKNGSQRTILQIASLKVLRLRQLSISKT